MGDTFPDCCFHPVKPTKQILREEWNNIKRLPKEDGIYMVMRKKPWREEYAIWFLAFKNNKFKKQKGWNNVYWKEID